MRYQQTNKVCQTTQMFSQATVVKKISGFTTQERLRAKLSRSCTDHINTRMASMEACSGIKTIPSESILCNCYLSLVAMNVVVNGMCQTAIY